MSEGIAHWEGYLRRLVDQGYADDEIEQHLDLLDGRWAVMFTADGEWLDWRELHGRRRVLTLLASIRRHGTPTPLAREKIPKLLEAYRKTGSRRSAADLVGVDRGTVADWERRGWLTLSKPRQ